MEPLLDAAEMKTMTTYAEGSDTGLQGRRVVTQFPR